MSLTDEEIQHIYLRACPRLRQFLQRRVQCPDTAADLVHDLYFRLPRIRPAPCTDREVSHWLFRVATNLSVDHMRSVQRRSELLEEYKGDESEIDQAATPERETVAIERIRRLQDALALLPDRRAEILVLSRLEGCTHDQIAGRLGISRSLVEKEIVRALQHCRRVMDEEEGETNDE